MAKCPTQTWHNVWRHKWYNLGKVRNYKKYIIKTKAGLFSPDVNSGRGSGSACNVVFTLDGFDGVYRESCLSC